LFANVFSVSFTRMKHIFEHLYIVPQNTGETALQNEFFFRCILYQMDI
jgi:hypothetical protein